MNSISYLPKTFGSIASRYCRSSKKYSFGIRCRYGVSEVIFGMCIYGCMSPYEVQLFGWVTPANLGIRPANGVEDM